MSKGSRHRIGDFPTYQKNLPRSAVRPGDTVIVDGRIGHAIRKDYLASTWAVEFPDGTEEIREEEITHVEGGE
jgi:hypothetical protein